MDDQKYSGFFLVIDGIDGCGKSTQTKRIFEYLQSQSKKVYLTTEPSKGELGVILRKYLKIPTNPPPLDALIFAADRVDHCYFEILPKLQEGYIVISDRYVDSSLVYQSEQGKSHKISLDWLKSINKFCLTPDLTIILDIDPQIALHRKITQNEEISHHMEKFENLQFQSEIQKSFQKVSQNVPKHILLDASKDIDSITKEILGYLMKNNILSDI